MKKFYTLCLIMALSLGAYAQTKKIAVYSKCDEIYKDLVNNKLIDALIKTHEYIVVERESEYLNKLIEEYKYQHSGAVNDQDIISMGKQSGVEYICVSSNNTIQYNNGESQLYLNARIINVETAEIIASSNYGPVILVGSDDISTEIDVLCKNMIKYLYNRHKSNLPKIAIYDCQSNSAFADVSINVLTKYFINSDKYAVIERYSTFLEKLKSEHSYQRNGFVDDNEIAKLGQQCGVDYVCVSKITSTEQGNYNITVKLIDATTADIVSVKNKVCQLSMVYMEINNVAKEISNVTKEELSIKEVIDCQGNVYPVVKIGEQYWMAENLQCTKYDSQSENRGKTIEPSDFVTTKPYFYDGRMIKTKDSKNLTEDDRVKLGLYYNWTAAMGYNSTESVTQIGEYFGSRQGICPNGWRLPSENDVDILINYLGGEKNAYKILKSKRGWSDDGNMSVGEDKYGYNLLPSGAFNNEVVKMGYKSYFWTTDNAYAMENNEMCAKSISISSISDEIRKPYCICKSANPVRCIMKTPQPSITTDNSVRDCEGNVYPIVKINGYYWMAENLRSTKYDTKSPNAGKIIVTSDIWTYSPNMYDGSLPDTKYSKQLSETQQNKMGFYYNWAAALGFSREEVFATQDTITVQGICPNGWHIPNGMDYEFLMIEGEDAASKKLKSKSGWYHSKGTDEYGMNILPAGIISHELGTLSKGAHFCMWMNGGFEEKGKDEDKSRGFILYIDSEGETFIGGLNKQDMCSVRCVRNWY